MDDDAPLAGLRRLLAAVPELAAPLGAILDRRERLGRLPARLKVAASPAAARALAELLSARAVRAAGDGHVTLRLPAGLDTLLYAALGRAARDPAAEELALRAGLDAALVELGTAAATAATRAWLAAARAAPGELWDLARSDGLAAAAHEARAVALAVDAALALDQPIRLANFAARVLGHSKALVAGSDRLRRVGEALFVHDPRTRDEVFFDGLPVSARDAAFRALELRGVTRDEGALSVLVYGPLVYETRGRRFDGVAAHAALGDPCRLTLAQLRGARVVEPSFDRLTVLENRTPFLDLVDAVAAAGTGRELVVCSEGQAGWATVALLRLVREACPRLRARHAGDLDRSGVLILRSLARRSGLGLEPHLMDPATLRRFAGRTLPMSEAERGKLAALVADDPVDAPAHDLLVELAATGSWLEQEAFSAEALFPSGAHPKTATTPV